LGKLKDLWAELSTTEDSEKKKEIRKKINSIEQWMIDNKIGSIKEITDWTKTKDKKVYRFEASRDGGLNIPENTRTGNDRCGACKFNKHSYCGGDKPCLANV
jgi:hypothetical protein